MSPLLTFTLTTVTAPLTIKNYNNKKATKRNKSYFPF